MSVTIQKVRRDITLHFFVRAHEWVFGVVLVVMGRVLGHYGVASGLLGQALEFVAPIFIWAAAMQIVGLLRLGALIANGTFLRTRRASPVIRAAMAFLSLIGWLSFGLALFFAFPTGAAAYALLGLAVFEGIAFPVIMQEAGQIFFNQEGRTDVPVG